MAAIVAHEGLLTLVVGEGDVAVGAAWHPSALLALYEVGEASPVLEEDDLFASLEGLAHDLYEARRERAFHLPLALGLLDVYHFYCGQLHVAVAMGELDIGIEAFVGEVVDFEAGGSCAEERLGSEEVGEHEGCIARMVAGGGFLLLVALLVFFVDDDEGEVGKGEEDG